MKTPTLTRRQLGAGVGAIVVAFSLSPRVAAAAGKKLPGSLATNPTLDAWLRIEPDGAVTVFTGKVELGQGAVTALAQIAAEELDVAFNRVRMVSGDTARTPNEGFTAGSQSIENSGTALRLAGAEARAILLRKASARLDAPINRLKVRDGVITGPGGRKVTYGDLAEEGLLHREASAEVAPKPPAEHRIVGRPVHRLDIPAKVTGGAIYVQDMRLPGMLFGRVVRPPSYQATLESVDEAAARAMPGVVAVVRDGSFLGVVAKREEQAIAAREALRKSAKWKAGPELPDPKAIHAFLKGAPSQDEVISSKSAAAGPAAKTLEAAYTKLYTAHASIGPSCAVAQMSDGKLHVWSHTQGVFPLRTDLAKALKLPGSAVTVTHTQGAGCYGHNGADDVALDAALLARASGGQPVKLQWMRDDEFAWEPFGPAMVTQVRAGLAADGSIVDWQYEVWSNTHNYRPGVKDGTNLLASWYLATPQQPSPPRGIPQPSGAGDRNSVPLYEFPNQKVVNHLVVPMPLRVSALRTLGAYHNVFTTECFMDELALAAGIDPVEFRLRHLKDPRGRAAITAAAEKAGWKAGAKGDGRRGRGFAYSRYKNHATYVAVVADVEIDRKTGDVNVARMVAAVDAGQIINPDGLRNQIEGGLIQSTSWTTREQVTFDRHRVTSRDWIDYPILTMPEVPKIDLVLLDRPAESPLGAGEAAQGPAAAAIGNAIANAAGLRVRDLPFTPEKLKPLLG